MANDWSDPQAVERELARREREAPNGGGARPEPERVLRAVHAVLESQRAVRADLARLAEELATVRAHLAQREGATSADEEAAGGPALATQLAEAEGRLTARVAHLKAHVQAVSEALPELRALADSAAATPEALEALRAAVAPLADEVRGHTLENRSRQGFLSGLKVELEDMVKDARTALTARFAEEAKHVREALEENTAVVRRRHRRTRRFWLGLAGAVLIGLLGSLAGGLWLQSRYDVLPAHDPTRGWRDGIWNDYGLQLQDCILEARESGRTVNCLIAPPP